MTITEMRVHMDCAGCETKIRKALLKLDGIHDIDIDMVAQKVTVMGFAEQKKVLRTVRKTGRRAELWPYPYNPEYYNFNHHYHNFYGKNDEQRYYQNQILPPATVMTTYYGGQPAAASSYNYRHHGYDEDSHGYYQRPLYSTVVDERASAMFSDDNPHACSIM